jgi:hypothetical protein
MRATLACLLLLCAGVAQAKKVIECEQYKAEASTKQERSIFRLAISQDNTSVTYTLISGPEWFLPSNSRLQVVWLAKDGSRAVASWIAKDYGVHGKRWSPVYVLDLDFASPNYRQNSYGGFADFSEFISSPWKHECKRLD